MKIVVIGENCPEKDSVVEKLCSAYGVRALPEGLAESQGAANIKPGVYTSSNMTVSLARALYFDAIVLLPCRPKENRVTRFKANNERIWGVYEVDENGEATENVIKSHKGFPYDYQKKSYARLLQMRLNAAAGKTVAVAKIMPEFSKRV